MLVLTRRLGEEVRIVIGDREVFITVLAIRGKQVRIGCKAESDVRFDRPDRRKERDDDDGDV